ncbi:MAG: hypothetical protein J5796_01170 [Erysipelotrichaceae bacterium]|nr:hypothetical protein [Erysipelotrichaceae bacterium]
MSKELFEQRTKEYFGDDHAEYLESLKEPCHQGFFLNTNKAERQDILDLVDFPYEESTYDESSFSHSYDNIGKTIAYDLGLIYPQDTASSLTTKYIDTENVKTVVDMCAAPGGKTINILNRLPKDVLCIANDVNHSRALIMSQNLERPGLDNVIITNKDCSVLADQLENFADIVVLDAPCSGEGIVRKYPEVFDSYSLERINQLADIQKQLLEDAYKILKGNGQLVYSTCTYSFEEDEDQISSFLETHSDMYIVKIDLKSHSRLEGTVKLSPLEGTEGQFFCIMRKNDVDQESDISYLKTVTDKTLEKFISENLDLEEYYLYRYRDTYYMSLMPLPDLGSNIIRYGIKVGEMKNKRFELDHDFYRANSLKGHYRHVYELNENELARYVEGYELKADLKDAYYLLTYRNNSIGFAKCVNGTLKNKYPKGLRRVI